MVLTQLNTAFSKIVSHSFLLSQLRNYNNWKKRSIETKDYVDFLELCVIH